MKRTLVPVNKKDYTIKVGDKNAVAICGSWYCSKCGYKFLPIVNIEGKAQFQRAEFMIDVSCFCDQK